VSIVTWIRTIPYAEGNEELQNAVDKQRALYPQEYATPAFPDQVPGSSIVDAHSLIPGALFHAFATFGALMAPHLPLDRRQHEMIATAVSATNRCQY
jgi:alkylhydroperoxidase family enzyme